MGPWGQLSLIERTEGGAYRPGSGPPVQADLPPADDFSLYNPRRVRLNLPVRYGFDSLVLEQLPLTEFLRLTAVFMPL